MTLPCLSWRKVAIFSLSSVRLPLNTSGTVLYCTVKTFTSMGGFRAHLKARQRSGEVSAEEASRTSPIEVKVLDSYLTVASTIGPLASSSTSPRGEI